LAGRSQREGLPAAGAGNGLVLLAFAGVLELLSFETNVLYPHGDDCLNGRFCREFSGVWICFLHFFQNLAVLARRNSKQNKTVTSPGSRRPLSL